MSLNMIPDNQIDNFHQEIETPWKRSFLSLMRSTFVEDLITETDISFSSKHNQFIRENWDKIKHLTLVDPFRMGVLIDLLDQVKDIDGDIVECGSYKGGRGILMGLWLREKNGLSEMITFHKGWFNETVPPIKDTVKISLFHVDCDLYTSTNDCFPDLYPAVSEGGAILLDDFNDGGGGEKKAVHEYFEREEIKEAIQISPAPQSFIIKGQDAESSFQVGTQRYSYESIATNQPYLNWLIENFDLDLIKNINSLEGG